MPARELNGDLYELLTPAGDALETKHPLASTLILRAMIDFTLGASRASRYKHAARHLAECASMARRVEDFGTTPDQMTYDVNRHSNGTPFSALSASNRDPVLAWA